MLAAKGSPDVDDAVDAEILSCLDPESPRSFFLYAGAGSGKTRSLVSAVNHVRLQYKRAFELRGQKIAVITYTNAASDEIKRRLEYDPSVDVSTIHSFAWKLIGTFQTDIREWLREHLIEETQGLKSKSSRAGTQAEVARLYKIARNEARLATLDEIRQFTYSPAGDNRSRESLNHSEVISITTDLLNDKAVLQQILVTRHPILFIDESQDTNKHLLAALLAVQVNNPAKFSLGLFGDTMQRIYADGMTDLGGSIPNSWAKPVKQMNHRCPQRVVELINRIRMDVDQQTQLARDDCLQGTARLFLVSSTSVDKEGVEEFVGRRMSIVSGDPKWTGGENPESSNPAVKKLILEHHMAAQRMGFASLFAALTPLETQRTSLLDGSITGLQIFIQAVVPLVNALHEADHFGVARIVREHSPLLSADHLRSSASVGPASVQPLADAQFAVEKLRSLWDNGTPSLAKIMRVVSDTNLFEVPKELRLAMTAGQQVGGDIETHAKDIEVDAWRACLEVSFEEVLSYSRYVAGDSPFATHQSVKGLEFPRVMVIISDDESRGFMFSYEKLLGATNPTATDLKNVQENRDSSIDRTRRLFYVTCSRSEESLAVVAYTKSVELVRAHAISQGWFEEDEIEVIHDA